MGRGALFRLVGTAKTLRFSANFTCCSCNISFSCSSCLLSNHTCDKQAHLDWLQVEIAGLGPICRHSLAYSQGSLWCLGGFDGQNTLEDTLCIDIKQLGQLEASSHTTRPQTFERPHSPASKEHPNSQKQDEGNVQTDDSSSSVLQQIGKADRGADIEDLTAQMPPRPTGEGNLLRRAAKWLLQSSRTSASPSNEENLVDGGEIKVHATESPSIDLPNGNGSAQGQHEVSHSEGADYASEHKLDLPTPAVQNPAALQATAARGVHHYTSYAGTNTNLTPEASSQPSLLGEMPNAERSEDGIHAAESLEQGNEFLDGNNDTSDATAVDSALLKDLITGLKSEESLGNKSVSLDSHQAAYFQEPEAPLDSDRCSSAYFYNPNPTCRDISSLPHYKIPPPTYISSSKCALLHVKPC